MSETPRPSSAATGRRRRGVLLAASGLALVGASLFSGTAEATTPGLTFTPGQGTDATPMYVVVPQPCPVTSQNVVATAVGKGFPGAGQTVVTNSTAGVSHTQPFVLPLQNTFLGFAQSRQITLGGPYQVTLRCTDRLNRTTSVSFTGTVTFDGPTRYTAPEPSKALVDEIVADPALTQTGPGAVIPPTSPTSPPTSTQPGSDGASGGAADAGDGTTRSGGTGADSQQGAAAAPGGAAATDAVPGSQPSSAPAAARSAAAQDSNGWVAWVVVLAVALLGGSVVLRRRERGRAGQDEHGAAVPASRTGTSKAHMNDERTTEESRTAASPSH